MVRKLLDRAIEIEGLLRIIRDGNPLPETYTLLNDKTLELIEGVKELDMPQQNSTAQGDLDKEKSHSGPMIVIKNEQSRKEKETKLPPDEETPKLIDMTLELQDPIDDDNQNQDRDDLAEVEDDAIETDEAIETEQELETPGTIFEENSASEEEDDIMLSFEEDGEEPEETSDSEEKPEEEETIIEIKENDDIPEKTILEEPLIEIKHAPMPKKNEDNPSLKRPSKLKSAFSLNDRFLYSRELFGGNMKMFDSAIDHIEGIDDYQLIEDYFYKELEMDQEDAMVASFMDILRGRF